VGNTTHAELASIRVIYLFSIIFNVI